MWLAQSVSLWFSRVHATLLFHLPPHRLLVLSPSRRSMMRWEHAVLLFTEMTANLTFNCPSTAYMNSYCLSLCLPGCHFSLSISNITCLSSPRASLLLVLSPLLSSFHQITPSQSSTAIRDVSFNHASSSALFLSPLPPFLLPLLSHFFIPVSCVE